MLLTNTPGDAIPLRIRKKRLSQLEQNLLKQHGEDGIFGVTDARGMIKYISLPNREMSFYGSLSKKLKPGHYYFDKEGDSFVQGAAQAFMLGAYTFDQFKKPSKKEKVVLCVSKDVHVAVMPLIDATYLVRDLINTPANYLGPQEFEEKTREVLKPFDIKITTVKGKDLEDQYPLIHLVGKGAEEARAPRLLMIKSMPKGASKHIALVGKGVCFDTGGLNLKNDAGMYYMKKDMGGAALMLGLAYLLLLKKAQVGFTLYLPLVENAIGSRAMRPLDIMKSRKGITVEIGNTDAEGRLILADALTRACEEKPDLIINAATLTGAARVALGTELPAFFTNTPWLSETFLSAGETEDDPAWQLPLYQPYRDQLKSIHADIKNISNGGYGGAIIAALFLEEFIDHGCPWLHFDFMGWNLRGTPTGPEGGEAMGLRAFYRVIEDMGPTP